MAAPPEPAPAAASVGAPEAPAAAPAPEAPAAAPAPEAPAAAPAPEAPAPPSPAPTPDADPVAARLILPDPLPRRYLEVALEALRDAEPAELPGALRHYRSFTPRGLRHTRVVTSVRRALDDQGFRALVDERMLASEPVLADLIRAGRHTDVLASGEQPELVAAVGIALGLQGRAAVEASAERAADDPSTGDAAEDAPAPQVLAEVESLRRRAEAESATARLARDDLRAAREQMREAERRARRLEDQVADLEQRLAAAGLAAGRAEREAKAEQRRLSGRIAQLQTLYEDARRQIRAYRKSDGRLDPAILEAVRALHRDMEVLWRVSGVAGPEAGAASPARPSRRTPLPAPGGLRADDPATLLAWAAAGAALVLIDGYNATKHPLGYADHALEDQRTLLIDRCARLARRTRSEWVVVFDGADVGVVPGVRLRGIQMVFTDADRIADDEIVARVAAEPPERPVVVVSSDNEVRERAHALGANVVPVTALLTAP